MVRLLPIAPADLTPEQRALYERNCEQIASGFTAFTTMRDRAARDLFGQGGLNELVFWVGMYAQVSITLNAFDVPSEESFA